MTEDQEIARFVEEHGWYAVSIKDHAPCFTYTIGLMKTFDHPELIIFGLESDQSGSVLSNMVHYLREGQSYAQPDSYLGILEHYPIATRRVHSTQHQMYLGYAMGFCRLIGRIGQLDANQVFWPDSRGYFPFQSQCDEDTYRLQPRLDLAIPATEIEEWEGEWRPE